MRTWTAGLVAAAAFAALPPLIGFQPYYLFLLSGAFLWASVASAWNLLACAGQISFGHAAFFGIGAYAAALLSLAGLSPWVAMGLGGLAGAAGAVLIGLGSERLKGAYLALATLAYAEAWRGLALNWTDLTGGGAGLIGIPPLPVLGWLPAALTSGRAGGYYAGFGILLATLALLAGILGSRAGLAFAAVRAEEERASLLGLRPLGWKLLAFGLSGGITGLAGALYVHVVRVVEPDLVFNRYYSILPLVMAMFGGLGTLLGPAAAGIALYLLSELVLHPLLPGLHQVGYALALILVILYWPGGLAGLFSGRGRAHP
ncbi:MAG TPA: branched-chain amino acid ABC transporter permease [Methylomirabilota bacterium]|nr:branched-chain amino acid ABC transporter permease [Methylomirabilota bacterium]